MNARAILEWTIIVLVLALVAALGAYALVLLVVT